MANEKPIALIAEDEDIVSRLMARYLAPKGYEVRSYLSGEEALVEAQRMHVHGIAPSIFITDQGLKGQMKGLDLIPQVRQLFPDVPVLMVSGGPEHAPAVSAQQGVFVHKPMSKDAFLAGVSRAYQAVDAQEPGTAPPVAARWTPESEPQLTPQQAAQQAISKHYQLIDQLLETMDAWSFPATGRDAEAAGRYREQYSQLEAMSRVLSALDKPLTRQLDTPPDQDQPTLLAGARVINGMIPLVRDLAQKNQALPDELIGEMQELARLVTFAAGVNPPERKPGVSEVS